MRFRRHHVDPKVTTLKGTAQKYEQRGKYRQAARCYRKLSRMEPENPRWPHKLGDALRRLGKLTQALNSYEHAVTLYSSDGWLQKAEALADLVKRLDAKRNPTLAAYRGEAKEKRDPSNEPLSAMSDQRAPSSPSNSTIGGNPDSIPVAADGVTIEQGTGVVVPQFLPPGGDALPVPGSEHDSEAKAASAPDMVDVKVAPSKAEKKAPSPRRRKKATGKRKSTPSRPMVIGKGKLPAAPRRKKKSSAVSQQQKKRPTRARADAPTRRARPATRTPRIEIAPPALKVEILAEPPPPPGRPSAPARPAAPQPPPIPSAKETNSSVIVMAPEAIQQAVRKDRRQKSTGFPVEPTPTTTALPTARVVELLGANPALKGAPRSALEAIAAAGQVISLDADEMLYQAGAKAEAIYFLLDGELAMHRGSGRVVELSSLTGTGLLGEVAHLTGQIHTRTVEALAPTRLVRVEPDRASSLLGEHKALNSRLRASFKDRMINQAVNEHSLFKPYPAADRRRLADRFQLTGVEAGRSLMRQGVDADALYMVLHGTLGVWQDRAARRSVEAGDLLGASPLVEQRPSEVTVMATTHCWVLRLDRTAFWEAAMEQPLLLEAVSEKRPTGRLPMLPVSGDSLTSSNKRNLPSGSDNAIC